MDLNIIASSSEPTASLRPTVADRGRQETSSKPLTFETDHESKLLLLLTVFNWNAGKVNELLKRGADPNTCDERGYSPLHFAALYSENIECIRQLLQHGADPNLPNEHGHTALHLAIAKNETVESVKALLEFGAHTNFINNLKQTPLHLLSARTDSNVITTLVEHGADIQMLDSRGQTPLDIAVAFAPSLTKLLVKYTLFHSFAGDFRNLNSLSAYIYSKNYENVARYFQECVSELRKMNSMKIRGGFSFYDFVITRNSNIPLFAENERTQNVTRKENLLVDYPTYSDIILPKVNSALERGLLLKKLADVSVYSRNGSGWTFGEKIPFNYDCSTGLAKHLFNDSLCNLMLAFYNSEPVVPVVSFATRKSGRRVLVDSESSCTIKGRLE